MPKPKKDWNREFKVVELLLRGKTYKQVAFDVGLSHSAVAKVAKRWPLFFWHRFRRRAWVLNRKPVQRD